MNPNDHAMSRSITLRFLAEPGDVNFGGKVHGGAVMKWIDQASYACAVGWSGQYCVTIYVGGIRFHKPIFIGQIVELDAKVVHTGNSSIHVWVEVSASDPKTGKRKRTTSCLIVFVAVDEAGDPTSVPTWVPQTDEDKQLAEHAIRSAAAQREQDKRLG